MSKGSAAKIATVVLPVVLEVEAGFDLRGSAHGGHVLVGVENLPMIDFGLCERPQPGEKQFFLTVPTANPATYCVDEKDASHTWLTIVIRQFGTRFPTVLRVLH